MGCNYTECHSKAVRDDAREGERELDRQTDTDIHGGLGTRMMRENDEERKG